MIDVRNAVAQSINYLQSIHDLMGEPQNLRLEEVELSDDQKIWIITLGFTYKSDSDEMMKSVFGENYNQNRVYKTFKVNAETGEVKGMNIRQL